MSKTNYLKHVEYGFNAKDEIIHRDIQHVLSIGKSSSCVKCFDHACASLYNWTVNDKFVTCKDCIEAMKSKEWKIWQKSSFYNGKKNKK